MANVEISDIISRELTIYSQSVTEAIKEEAKAHMKELVKSTKNTAPVGHRQRHYKDNIKSRKVSEDDRGATYQWYVDGPDYRLSHLLENGHALRNGGRVAGTHFIQRASDPILADFVEKVEEAIRNG